MELTVCDASQGLVEGGRVAVICQGDTHSNRQKPSGQSEGLFVLQEPVPEALIVHLVPLPQHTEEEIRTGFQRMIGLLPPKWVCSVSFSVC